MSVCVIDPSPVSRKVQINPMVLTTCYFDLPLRAKYVMPRGFCCIFKKPYKQHAETQNDMCFAASIFLLKVAKNTYLCWDMSLVSKSAKTFKTKFVFDVSLLLACKIKGLFSRLRPAHTSTIPNKRQNGFRTTQLQRGLNFRSHFRSAKVLH